MDKAEAKRFTTTIEKYGLALCGTLYPSQIDQLQKALASYRNYGRIPKIDDSFTNLAFRMVVADLIWQEKQETE